MSLAIKPVERADESWILTFLATAHLATSDLTGSSFGNFRIAWDGDQRIGVAGLECHGPTGLLRSVAVKDTRRGTGVGRQLVRALEAHARECGVERLFLLTDTARVFFARLGYHALTRNQVPASIQGSPEFATLCPASCTSMAKWIARSTRHVLFLCTGNSARSILAEAIFNHLASRDSPVQALSAGSHPRSAVHPLALEILQENHVPTDGLHAKSWDGFDAPDAPRIDVVITLCDQAAAEPCPLWPGQPVRAHWGLPDPASKLGTDDARRRAFRETFEVLHRRISRLAALPLHALAPSELRLCLEESGEA